MATAELEVIRPVEQVYREVADVADQDGKTSKGQVKESMSLGLFVYKRLKRLCAEVPDLGGLGVVPEDERSKSKQFSEDISKVYQDWLKTSRSLLDSINRVAAGDPDFVIGLDLYAEFKDAIKDVSLMSLDTDRVNRSIASLQAGQGVTFEQAMDQLRANLR